MAGEDPSVKVNPGPVVLSPLAIAADSFELIGEPERLIVASQPVQSDQKVAEPASAGFSPMVVLEQALCEPAREALARKLHHPGEAHDGLVQVTPVERNQPEIVMAFGIALERVGKEPQNRFSPVEISLVIKVRNLLFNIYRYFSPAQPPPPIKFVVAIPLIRLPIAELQSPADQFNQILELVAMLPEKLGRGEEPLRLVEHQLACEGTEIGAEPLDHLRLPIFVLFGQDVDVSGKLPPDPLPGKADFGILEFEQVLEKLALGVVEGRDRLLFGIECKENALAHLACFGIPRSVRLLMRFRTASRIALIKPARSPSTPNSSRPASAIISSTDGLGRHGSS